jgi:osmotically-inducible protein OsmY
MNPPLSKSHTTRIGLPALLVLLALALALPGLAGCASAVVGAGAAAGIAAFEERPVKVIARDSKMSAELKIALLEISEQHFAKVGIEVFEGRVLLTGVVPTEQMRADAVSAAWKIAGIKAVLNELAIGDQALTDTARDGWITTQLTSKLTFDKHVRAINYAIETVGGTIYLIGIAQNQAELDRVIAHARSVGYVRNVISHVRVKPAS